MAAVFLASPSDWAGAGARSEADAWVAGLLGGAAALVPLVLALARPGAPATRQAAAVGQMVMGALMIHLGGAGSRRTSTSSGRSPSSPSTATGG